MSEKCYYSGECDCSSNSGYGERSPDNCDDCGEDFCTKHMKSHKKDGTCEKIQRGYIDDEMKENKELLKNMPTDLLEAELQSRKEQAERE